MKTDAGTWLTGYGEGAWLRIRQIFRQTEMQKNENQKRVSCDFLIKVFVNLPVLDTFPFPEIFRFNYR